MVLLVTKTRSQFARMEQDRFIHLTIYKLLEKSMRTELHQSKSVYVDCILLIGS